MCVAIFVYAVLVSKGDALAVSITFFIVVVIAGPISGANVNPAVSTGVWITNRQWKKDFAFYLLFMLAEFAGGLFGIALSYLIVMPNAI